MVVVWKPIKPKRFQAQVFRAIIKAAMKQTGVDIKKDFEQTTATWKHKPKFEILLGIERGAEVMVSTDDEIYRWVNDGTEEHIILPVNAQALRFREGFIPKTRPGSLISAEGASFGRVLFRAGVIHPGTEARDFEKQIYKKWQPRFKRRMEQAMKQAAKASGHAI